MATRSNILAWRIPWTEEPGGLQSMGSQRVRLNGAPLINREQQAAIVLPDPKEGSPLDLPISGHQELFEKEARKIAEGCFVWGGGLQMKPVKANSSRGKPRASPWDRRMSLLVIRQIKQRFFPLEEVCPCFAVRRLSTSPEVGQMKF